MYVKLTTVNMMIMKILKIVVLLVSIIMFSIQFRKATFNLLNPPIIDSTYETNITVDDLPLITICPVNQTNHIIFRCSFSQLNN